MAPPPATSLFQDGGIFQSPPPPQAPLPGGAAPRPGGPYIPPGPAAGEPDRAAPRPAGPYIPPGKRALLGRRQSPPPPPPPARPPGPIQCVTFVDGKPVEGPVDDSVFKIQDIRLKTGQL